MGLAIFYQLRPKNCKFNFLPSLLYWTIQSQQRRQKHDALVFYSRKEILEQEILRVLIGFYQIWQWKDKNVAGSLTLSKTKAQWDEDPFSSSKLLMLYFWFFYI